MSGLPAPAPDSAPKPEVPAIGGGPSEILHGLAQAPPSVAAEAFTQAVSASGAALEQQKCDAQTELPEMPAPTGLPALEQRKPEAELPAPAQPAGLDVTATEGAPAVAVAPTPEAPVVKQAPTLLKGSDQDPDAAVSQSAQGELASADLPADEMPTTLGERPVVDTSGTADPAQMDATGATATQQVVEERTKSQALMSQDFGENAIYPCPSDEVLKSDQALSVAVPATDAAPKPVKLDPDVAAGLDSSLGPVFQQRVSERAAEYDAGDRKFQADSAAARSKTQDDIASLEDQARSEQTAQQQAAKAEVADQRAQWHTEVAGVQAEFDQKSAKAKEEHRAKVETERRKGDEKAAAHYAEAEQKADAAKQEAEAKAADKKKEAEEDSGGFWGWVKSKAKALIDAVKSALNFIFDQLRKAVKAIFEAVKKVVLAVIEVARMAIVGLIKAFGEVLKAYVAVALAAFPDIAKRINAKIDAAVDTAVAAVNKAADLLKKGVSALLDFLAKTIDSALGLIQSIYNGLLTVIGMLISGEFFELMRKLGNLIEAAKQVPDTFETAALEELLGGNLDEPLSPAELMQAGKSPPGVQGQPAPASEAALPTAPWTEANVGVTSVAPNVELSPELAGELNARAGGRDGVVEFAAVEDPSRTMEAVMAEARGPDETTAPDKLPPDGLTPVERAGVKWSLMKKGIAEWWSNNWGKVLLGAAAAILGFIALNIVTGGAITAAIPAIMGVLGPLFVGMTILKLADYVKQYVELAWNGKIQEGGKALSKALAAGAIELITWLTFKVGGAALKGAKALGKAAVKGVVAIGKRVIAAVSKGIKWILGKGKILFEGLAETGLGKRLTRLAELGEELLQRLRFRKFRFVIKGRWFDLEGFINPWIKIFRGEIREVKAGTKGAEKVTEDELKAIKEGRRPPEGPLKEGDVGDYRKLKSDKHNVVNDGLTPDHIPSRAALVEKYKQKLISEGRSEPWNAAELDRMKQINQEGVTIATRTKVHVEGSRTYGSKNQAAQIALDAADLEAATRRDIEAVFEHLAEQGELNPKIWASYVKVYQENVLRGVFKFKPGVNEMFMKYLKLARAVP